MQQKKVDMKSLNWITPIWMHWQQFKQNYDMGINFATKYRKDRNFPCFFAILTKNVELRN